VWSDSAVRRYARDAGPLLERLNELTRCDCTSRNPQKAKALSKRMDALEQRIAELREQEALDAIRPDLDGNQVMAQLGLPPGRQVGQALAFLLELRLDEGPLGEVEAARRLAAWWAEQSGFDKVSGWTLPAPEAAPGSDPQWTVTIIYKPADSGPRPATLH